jgi:hypothetical protein
MFDIYTTQPQVLSDLDAEALASALERNGLAGLAGRIRYGLANDTLVEIDPTEHGSWWKHSTWPIRGALHGRRRPRRSRRTSGLAWQASRPWLRARWASRSGRLDKIGRE